MKDIMGMMGKIKDMQVKMERMQEEMAALECEGVAGGGVVSVRLSGKGQMLGLKTAQLGHRLAGLPARSGKQQPGAIGIELSDGGTIQDADGFAAGHGWCRRAIGMPVAARNQCVLGLVEMRLRCGHTHPKGLLRSIPGMKGRPRSRCVT